MISFLFIRDFLTSLFEEIKKDLGRFFVLVFTLIGIFNRFRNLGHPYIYTDESISSLAAVNGFSHFPPLLPSGSEYFGHWTHTYLLTFSYKILGHTDWAGRLPSAVLGILSIPLIYIVGKKIFNKEVGLLSSGLLTFSSISIFWSRMIRHYSLLLFIVLLILFTYFNYLDKPKKNIISLFILFTLGFFTFPPVISLLPAIIIIHLIILNKQIYINWILPAYILIFVLGLSLFVLDFPFLRFFEKILVNLVGESRTNFKGLSFLTPHSMVKVLIILSLIISTLLVTFYMYYGGSKKDKVISSLNLVPFLVLIVIPMFSGDIRTRYFFFYLPIFLLFSSYIFFKITEKSFSKLSFLEFRKEYLKISVLVIFILLIPFLTSLAPQVTLNNIFKDSFLYTYPKNPEKGPHQFGPPFIKVRPAAEKIKLTDSEENIKEPIPVVSTSKAFTGTNSLYRYLNYYDYSNNIKDLEYKMYSYVKTEKTKISFYLPIEKLGNDKELLEVMDRNKQGWVVLSGRYEADQILLEEIGDELNQTYNSSKITVYRWS
ncbi:MAG: Glycosyltransferase of PMT family ArnT [Candidatus Methanohalarchaeum thermophilum]|uniref:Glycosyltransferase of PMT family ArnT n=1 Tax=Methanohalarchaeum thermophilum TaxID=1903181 RepID=A0A1Q6DSR2_METT1|nr:MAG: Glycosyltransferase of PMT family ArnT [Candidatus Methanohalarchaeum thermophilum]